MDRPRVITCNQASVGGRLDGALLRAGLVDEVDVEFPQGAVFGVLEATE